MNTETIFIYTLILLVSAMAFLYLLRRIMKLREEKEKIKHKDMSKVGFVVETFHELFSNLKEKEKELEALKKVAEQRAEDVESYNQNILQSVPSGVISFGRDLKIKSINSSAERILRLKAEDAVGKSYDELLGKPITELLEKGKFVERGEVQYQTSDGRLVWLGLTFSSLRDNKGNEIGNILVFTDLTELKALESQAELRKRLSSLGEISAGIAHEIRNPLGVIAGYTKLLSKKVDRALMPTVESIAKEIDVIDRIVSDFLSFAKPVELVISKINVYDVINGCITNVLGDRSDIEVFWDMDKSVAAKADEVLLRQAFTNLIQNAVDAMREGGKLIFGYSNMGEYSEIRISDSGHGISEGIRDRIFLPFYTTKEKGTGLGLAIVHKIIVSHGGAIFVESSDKGTTFRLRLPKN